MLTISPSIIVITLTDPSDVTTPVVTLNNLETENILTSPVEIIASVSDANLVSWQLSMRSASDSQYTLIASGHKTLEQQAIYTFDPTQLLNGLYTLILEGEDANGQISQALQTLRVEGQMKVGNFSIAFEDLNIPVAGIPISVTRNYDTRQKHLDLDFGYGWRVGYQTIRVDEPIPAGVNWQINSYGGIFGQKCVQSNGNRLVSINLPNGQVETFKAMAEPECSSLIATTDVQLVYQPMEGTYSRLEQTDYGQLRLAGNSIINLNNPDGPVDPQHYRLTTAQGIVYELDDQFGITRVTDLNNNTLTFSNDGIQHSSGVAITFERDSNDHISAIIAPDGTRLEYRYDAAGNLISVNDQVHDITRFSYQSDHALTDITDPRGIRVARNEYDANGRLIAQIDADGNRLEYSHDIKGRREAITDRNGNTTLYTYDNQGNVLAETNALGETTLHTYDNDYNELSRSDALGNTTAWTYDQYGNQLTETDALGHITTSSYNSQSGLKTQTDAQGNLIISNTYKTYTYPGGVLLRSDLY